MSVWPPRSSGLNRQFSTRIGFVVLKHSPRPLFKHNHITSNAAERSLNLPDLTLASDLDIYDRNIEHHGELGVISSSQGVIAVATTRNLSQCRVWRIVFAG